MVTENDKNMICYHILQRGDITRWSGWKKRKKDIADEYPELMMALTNLKIAQITLDAIVEKIGNELT